MVLCELLEPHGAFRVGQQQDPSIVAIGGLCQWISPRRFRLCCSACRQDMGERAEGVGFEVIGIQGGLKA